jgi:dynein heavy chain
MDQVAKLERNLKATQDEVQELEDKAADCEARLKKAKSLITGLGGQKTAWKAESERLSSVYVNLTGDVLISSGVIAYLGAFTAKYRVDICEQWVK